MCRTPESCVQGGFMQKSQAYGQRLVRGQAPSYERLQARFAEDGSRPPSPPQALHCGWGRLLIGHTYPDAAALASDLLTEQPGERDIALYVAAPHQVLAQAPQQLFLDPSDTLRLWFTDYRPARRGFRGYRVRRAQNAEDWQAINELYQLRGMLPIDPGKLTPRHLGGPVYWLAEDEDSSAVIGSVMGLNHHKAYQDPDHGSSLWCLAVDPRCSRPGVGEVLVRHLIEHFMSRGLSHLDLSVLHDNEQAKGLYAKLGFRELQTFSIKRKNGINEALFLGPGPHTPMNPYARIIVDEALRRGIEVQVDNAAFLAEHGSLVVKPVDGEQGQGVAVDLRTPLDVQDAIERASTFDSRVLLESFHPGFDLRILVIGFAVVAAAIRRPAEVIGDGQHSIGELIDAQSRRRQAATEGESRIPKDAETLRTLHAAGVDYDSVLPAGQRLAVRKTANLHTGGSLEDVTDILHPVLADAAVKAARALDIPVVGLDLLVPAADQPEYVFIEANERAGLANHQPQPTAERFLDLLFPFSQTPS